MKKSLFFLVLLILLVCLTTPLSAQKMKDNPKCQNWHSVAGEWDWKVESKETPAGPWTPGPGGFWKAGWLYDGQFFQWQAQNNDGSSFLHIFGYDRLLQTHTSAGVTSEGWRWIVKSGDWNDNVFTANWLDISPEGERLYGRCMWNFESDFDSASISCDQFTDGHWWNFRRFKGQKRP